MSNHIVDSPAHWPVVASAEQFRGKIISVRTDTIRVPEGTTAEREVVEHPGAVGVVALDTDDRVLMIRQYRHAVGRELWELPAGLRDVAGEPTAQTGRRELLEETGYRARDWHVLADYFSSPGILTERLRVFLARGLEEVPDGRPGFRAGKRRGAPGTGLGAAGPCGLPGAVR